jgi:hypothetical protein
MAKFIDSSSVTGIIRSTGSDDERTDSAAPTPPTAAAHHVVAAERAVRADEVARTRDGERIALHAHRQRRGEVRQRGGSAPSSNAGIVKERLGEIERGQSGD